MASLSTNNALNNRKPLLKHLHTPTNTTCEPPPPLHTTQEGAVTPSSGLIHVTATIPEEALSAFYGFVSQMHKRYPVISTKKRRSFVQKHTNYLCDYVPSPDELTSSTTGQNPTQHKTQNDKARMHLESRLLDVMNKFDVKELDVETNLKKQCEKNKCKLKDEMLKAHKSYANKLRINAGYTIKKRAVAPNVQFTGEHEIRKDFSELKLQSIMLPREEADKLRLDIKEHHARMEERYKPFIDQQDKLAKERLDVLRSSRPYRRIAMQHNTEQNLQCVKKVSKITAPVKELIEKVEAITSKIDKFEHRVMSQNNLVPTAEGKARDTKDNVSAVKTRKPQETPGKYLTGARQVDAVTKITEQLLAMSMYPNSNKIQKKLDTMIDCIGAGEFPAEYLQPNLQQIQEVRQRFNKNRNARPELHLILPNQWLNL